MIPFEELIRISGLINNFDLFYEMADDAEGKVWDRGRTSSAIIRLKLAGLNLTELETVKVNLNSIGLVVIDRYFYDCFKDLTVKVLNLEDVRKSIGTDSNNKEPDSSLEER